MEFSPFNPIVKLCLQGMALEEKNDIESALKIFMQAWNEAQIDDEKFLCAHYIARCQGGVEAQLQWLETTLQLATTINNDVVNSALPNLHLNIAKCYEAMNDRDKAMFHTEHSKLLQAHPTDKGPFYHGTRADLKVNDELVAGGLSNYKADFTMQHIYFTGLVNGAGLAAALAKGDGRERVYRVEPTGTFENDPNLTDKKFPGNPSRSYRSTAPLKIVGEVTEWVRHSDEDIAQFRKKVEAQNGDIIN